MNINLSNAVDQCYVHEDHIVTQCYVCHRIRIASEWLPALDVITHGARISHGLCPECYKIELARVEKEMKELDHE